MVIDFCAEDECFLPVLGQKYGQARRFEEGDEYCRHLREEHGHRYAKLDDLGGPVENLLDGWAK